ncbi:DNA helicase-like protein [Elysia marginata]|uniref:DNA helicase-like protein n=1 Tax=Elysia marginata TaxID=1093978 RepID=A0AAV4H0U3_9GAST|nr:DNA helicase-like protein [Elysia marginata]
MKVAELMSDLTKKKLFGTVIAYVRVVEFQKRGLPHVHILLILEHNSKPKTVEQIDQIVKAELSDDPDLRKLVEKHMLHGPCGIGFPQSPCIRDNSCSKRFPRPFIAQTLLTESSYPEYQRRDSNQSVEKGGAILDNRWVVPYNPFLLKKYQAHVYVEVCNSITAVKYLYKYVYKGHDRVIVEFQGGQENEIKKYVDARYVSASEACWRLFHFELQDQYPSIQRLAIHLPGQQSVVYREGHAQVALQNIQDTTLTAWFEANETYEEARNLRYDEMQENFTWDIKTRKWKPRQRKLSIGRLYNACPSEGERFFLRLLLQHIKGARSYEDLRTLENGQVCNTFHEAALQRGLQQDDGEWRFCLEEAALTSNPIHLRKLFSVILIFCAPSDPVGLWTQFHPHMCEDYTYHYQQRNEIHHPD